MSRTVAATAPQRAAEPGFVVGVLLSVVKAFGYLILGLVFSILMEWLGLVFWWPEEGTHHSRAMLEQELGYLGLYHQDHPLFADPKGFAQAFADQFYHYVIEATGLASGIQRLNAPATAHDSTVVKISRGFYQPLASYVIATITISQVYALRLAVLVLSMPVFVLAGIVGLTDALVARVRPASFITTPNGLWCRAWRWPGSSTSPLR
jgi:integrating conjugative element membrane protein (TIGR03747 family)